MRSLEINSYLVRSFHGIREFQSGSSSNADGDDLRDKKSDPADHQHHCAESWRGVQ
jgi:hypothetical protein